MKNPKELVTLQWFHDGVLTSEVIEKRVVYTDKKGRYIRSMGRRFNLDTRNKYQWHVQSVKKLSFSDGPFDPLRPMRNI